MCNEEKIVKSVTFNSNVKVILIPERLEYGLISDNIWWKNTDLTKFKNECVFELNTVISFSLDEFEKHLENLDLEVNKKNLFLLAQDRTYQLTPLLKL